MVFTCLSIGSVSKPRLNCKVGSSGNWRQMRFDPFNNKIAETPKQLFIRFWCVRTITFECAAECGPWTVGIGVGVHRRFVMTTERYCNRSSAVRVIPFKVSTQPYFDARFNVEAGRQFDLTIAVPVLADPGFWAALGKSRRRFLNLK